MEKNVLSTDLTGKVAVVTGASGTLCSIFAKALARAGAKVALLGRNMDKLKALSYNEVKKLRALFAYAADCEPDAQGRILLPAKLREYAGLTREVVVIGSFDRAEIWDAERWAAVENDAFASGELESAMAEMGL